MSRKGREGGEMDIADRGGEREREKYIKEREKKLVIWKRGRSALDARRTCNTTNRGTGPEKVTKREM